MRWVDSLVSLNVADTVQSFDDLTSSLADNDRRGLTLTRTLIHMYFMGANTDETAAGHQAVDVGIAMIDADALAASVFPDTDSETDEPSRPWVWRDRILCRQDVQTTGNPVWGEVRADIRAQRKMGNSRTVLIIDSNAAAGTAFNVRAIGIIRCGYLLP